MTSNSRPRKGGAANKESEPSAQAASTPESTGSPAPAPSAKPKASRKTAAPSDATSASKSRPAGSTTAPGPIVGVALHCAHKVRDDIAACFRISDAERLREEDPYTDLWTSACDVRVTALPHDPINIYYVARKPARRSS